MKKAVVDIIKEHPGESGIIYCLSRTDCERMAESINDALGKRAATFYHAGMEDGAERSEHQREWFDGRVAVIVATIGADARGPQVEHVSQIAIGTGSAEERDRALTLG